MGRFLHVTFFVAVCAAAGAQFAEASNLDTRFYYRLTNKFLGPRSSLTVYVSGGNRLLKMEVTSHDATQLWEFVDRGRGKYAIHSVAFGDSFSLDVINDGRNDKVQLARTGQYSGQFWTLTPWGDGTYKLTNDFTGVAKALDTYSDTLGAFLAHGDHTGQHWTPTRAGQVGSLTKEDPAKLWRKSIQLSEVGSVFTPKK
jgi:hypothetical protein